MPIIAHVVLRGVTKEQFNRVRDEAAYLERTPEGGLTHVTWWEGDDCHNLDAWESEDAFNTFGANRLGPAMARAGVDAKPEVTFHAAYEVYAPKILRLTS